MCLQVLEWRTEYFYYACSSQKRGRTVVIATLLSYILLMQIVALWFAFQIRKVKVTSECMM